jgi:hypothetical protein
MKEVHSVRLFSKRQSQVLFQYLHFTLLLMELSIAMN